MPTVPLSVVWIHEYHHSPMPLVHIDLWGGRTWIWAMYLRHVPDMLVHPQGFSSTHACPHDQKNVSASSSGISIVQARRMNLFLKHNPQHPPLCIIPSCMVGTHIMVVHEEPKLDLPDNYDWDAILNCSHWAHWWLWKSCDGFRKLQRWFVYCMKGVWFLHDNTSLTWDIYPNLLVQEQKKYLLGLRNPFVQCQLLWIIYQSLLYFYYQCTLPVLTSSPTIHPSSFSLSSYISATWATPVKQDAVAGLPLLVQWILTSLLPDLVPGI